MDNNHGTNFLKKFISFFIAFAFAFQQMIMMPSVPNAFAASLPAPEPNSVMTDITYELIGPTSARFTWKSIDRVTRLPKAVLGGIYWGAHENLLNRTGFFQPEESAVPTTEHTAVITGLIPDTQFHYQIFPLTQDQPHLDHQNRTVPPWISRPETIKPVVSNIQIKDIDANSAVVTWQTSEPATAEVNLLDVRSVQDLRLTTGHSVLLYGLEPEKEYSFYVSSTDPFGNKGTSSKIQTFKTLKDDGANTDVVTLRIVSPEDNTSVEGPEVMVHYEITGSPHHLHYQIDGGDELKAPDLSGHLHLSALPKSLHTLRMYLAASDHSLIPGTEQFVTFATETEPVNNNDEGIGDPSEPISLAILSPIKNGAIVYGSALMVHYQITGSPHHLHYQLDQDVEQKAPDFSGRIRLVNLSEGTHAFKMYLAAADHSVIAGTEKSISFTVKPPADGGHIHGQSTPAEEPGLFFTTHHDTVPNFVHEDFARALNKNRIVSRQDGNWSIPGTWQGGVIPGNNDVVVIKHHVFFNASTSIDSLGIYPGGTLEFSRIQNTELRVVHLEVFKGGYLDIGTKENPIPEAVKSEIIFRDVPIITGAENEASNQPGKDPLRWGNGLLVLDGKLTMSGSPKDKTFVRLAAEAKKNGTSLQLSQPVSGWKTGDMLLLPDTSRYQQKDKYDRKRKDPKWEQIELANVSDDGKTLFLKTPLQFDHPGAKDSNGTIKFLGHVGNLSRNVVVRSENPNGVRGHTAFLNRADTDVNNVLFKDLGRTRADTMINNTVIQNGQVVHMGTNQIARYPVHFHHLIGPAPDEMPAHGYQFRFSGNAVINGPKWGIAIHGSHYGLVKQNVVYNTFGGGIVFEDGSESFNRLQENFMVRSDGTGEAPDIRGKGDPTVMKQDEKGAWVGDGDSAYEGSGMWSRGSYNYYLNNVSVDMGFAGFMVFSFHSEHPINKTNIPLYQGADSHMDGQNTSIMTTNMLPLIYQNNESYGNRVSDFEFWSIGGEEHPPLPYTVKNLISWHSNVGLQTFYSEQINVNGYAVTGDGNGNGFDGHPVSLHADRWDVQNMSRGLNMYTFPDIKIKNSHLQNRNTNIFITKSDTEKKDVGIPRIVEIKDVTFEPISGFPSTSIFRQLAYPSETNMMMADRVMVTNHNGIEGNNFEVMYPEQSPDYIVPNTGMGKDALPAFNFEGRNMPWITLAPEADKTNRELWQIYGMAFAGKMAPAITTKQQDMLCSLASYDDKKTYPVLPCLVAQGVPSDLQMPKIDETGVIITPLSSGSVQISWATNEPATSQIEYMTKPWDSRYRGFLSPIDWTLTTNHKVILNDLEPKINYGFGIISTDAAGNTVRQIRSAYTFSTDTGTGTVNQPPVFGPVSNKTVEANSLVDFTVNATDPENAVLNFAVINPPAGANFNSSTGSFKWTPNAGQAGTYNITFRVSDGKNTVSQVVTIVVGSGNTDTVPPQVSNLHVSDITEKSAVITFSTNESAVSRLTYGFNQNPDQATPWQTQFQTNHQANLGSLSSEKTYFYRAEVRDAAGNTSVSEVKTFVTAKPADQKPPVISGLKSINVSSDSAVISWITDRTSDSLVEYRRIGGAIVQVFNPSLATNHNVTISQLISNAQYEYRVKSKDASGNLSVSGISAFKTAAKTAPADVFPVLLAPIRNFSIDNSNILKTTFYIFENPSDKNFINDAKILVTSSLVPNSSGIQLLNQKLSEAMVPGQDTKQLDFEWSVNWPAVANADQVKNFKITLMPYLNPLNVSGPVQCGTASIVCGGPVALTVNVQDKPQIGPKPNRVPTAVSKSAAVTANQALILTLGGNDPDGDSIRFVMSDNPKNGTLSNINAALGVLTYTPKQNFTGTDILVFKVVDNKGAESSPATVSIQVQQAAENPPNHDHGSEEPANAVDAFWNGHHDSIPNFAHPNHAGNRMVMESIKSGNWFSPDIWQHGRVPSGEDVIIIKHNVSLDNFAEAHTVAVYPEGRLEFKTDVNTQLNIVNLEVAEGGELKIGDESNPVHSNVKAEIIFRDEPINLQIDPKQYGNGLVVFGTITVHGAPLSKSFMRLARGQNGEEPKKGDTQLILKAPVSGWNIGDKIILPDSRQLNFQERGECCGGVYVSQEEQPVISNIRSGVNGEMILDLAKPLQYDHKGGRDGDDRIEFLPHVANFNRNVMIHSEMLDPSNPQDRYCASDEFESIGCKTRGHVMFLHNAKIDVRYAQFKNVGRTAIDNLDNFVVDTQGKVTHIGTNQIGRYSVHFHHLNPNGSSEANPRFKFIGNAVGTDEAWADFKWDANPPASSLKKLFKWGIAIHGTDYGLVRDNFIYRTGGSGIVTEDGTENFNVIEDNFVMDIQGTGAGRADSDNAMPGREGSGFWLKGTNNYIRNNVSVKSRLKGYTFFGGGPFLEFSGNESYANKGGLTIWYINGTGTSKENRDAPQSTIKDFVSWNDIEDGVGLGYPSTNITFDHLIVRGDKHALHGTGFWFYDYQTRNFIIQNSELTGKERGIHVPTRNDERLIIKNSKLKNFFNVVNQTIGAPGGVGAPFTWKETILDNVKFEQLTGVPAALDGRKQQNIVMVYQVYDQNTNLALSDKVFVYGYNQNPGDNFQVFYKEQTPDFRIPKSAQGREMLTDPATGREYGNLTGCPAAGLTNIQCWNQFGVATAGAVLPAGAQAMDKIDGYVVKGNKPEGY